MLPVDFEQYDLATAFPKGANVTAASGGGGRGAARRLGQHPERRLQLPPGRTVQPLLPCPCRAQLTAAYNEVLTSLREEGARCRTTHRVDCGFPRCGALHPVPDLRPRCCPAGVYEELKNRFILSTGTCKTSQVDQTADQVTLHDVAGGHKKK